jgi:hypothetical protein
MSSNVKVNGVVIETLAAKMDAGLAGVGPDVKFMADGQLVDGPTLRGRLKDAMVPFAQANASKKQQDKDMAARKVAAPSSKKAVRSVANAVSAYCHGDPTLLDAFGLPIPKTPRELTASEKVSRTAKAKATRTARGTKGPRAKAKIKATGDFTVSVGAPPAAAPASGNTLAQMPSTQGLPAAAPASGNTLAQTPSTPPASGANGTLNGAGH